MRCQTSRQTGVGLIGCGPQIARKHQYEALLFDHDAPEQIIRLVMWAQDARDAYHRLRVEISSPLTVLSLTHQYMPMGSHPHVSPRGVDLVITHKESA